MKITFIKDCPPIIESGNSAYKVDDEADLRQGHLLVKAGYAVEGWGDDIVKTTVPEPEAAAEAPQAADLPDDYRELQALAKEAGIPANQPKAALIEALSDDD